MVGFMLRYRACYWEEVIAEEVGWGRWEGRDREMMMWQVDRGREKDGYGVSCKCNSLEICCIPLMKYLSLMDRRESH